MDRWVGKIAVVTGASAGIGLAVAKAFVNEGLVVVGFARRKEKMEKEMANQKGAKGKFYSFQCDVSKEDDVKEGFKWIKENLGTVQILINNAGVVIPGSFSKMNLSTGRNVIDTNLMGTMYCSHEALKMMQESKLDSHIVNINSIAGHRVYQFAGVQSNVYSATKFAITGFTETLQRELMGQNIRVTSISPGFVKTEMTTGSLNNALTGMPSIEAQDIADSIVYVVGTPHRVQITELTIRPLGEVFL